MCRSELWDEYERTCEWCGYKEPDDDTDDLNEYGHTGFYLHTSSGTAHVLGDPNMSDETAAALARMIECAIEAIKRGEIGNEDD